jgi:hypothetical protein
MLVVYGQGKANYGPRSSDSPPHGVDRPFFLDRPFFPKETRIKPSRLYRGRIYEEDSSRPWLIGFLSTGYEPLFISLFQYRIILYSNALIPIPHYRRP